MRRTLALLALIALSAVGCGGSDTQEPEATGTIAFTRGDHIWLMNADGSGQRRLARGLDPAWSPDGSKIAFTVDRSSSPIWVIDAEGRSLRRVTKRKYDTHSSPVWSPDGKTIAFEGYDDGNYWINVVGVDASDQRELWQRGGPYVDVAPVWSRDGRTIMFTNVHDNGVYVMNRDGSGRRVLARIEGEDRAPYVEWSPDRRRFTVGIHSDLWVMGADGKRLVMLFDSPIDEPGGPSGAAWSPDGRKIAFSVWQGKDPKAVSEIYVVDGDGSGLRKMTDNGDVDDYGPMWSPDGRAIAFTSDRDGNTEIYVMNADGSDQRNVSESPLEDSAPSWSPAN